MIWQVGQRVEVTRVQPAADGSVTVAKPAMASHGIVAVPGSRSTRRPDDADGARRRFRSPS